MSILLVFFASSVVIFGLTHFLALELHLYFIYEWLDIPMHILGGVIVALGIFILPLFNIRIPQRYFELIPVLALVLIVGLLWEVYEIWIGIPLLEPGFEKDIVVDIFMDLIGGYVGYVVATNVRNL